MTKEFQQILDAPNTAGQVFAAPSVDNTAASVITAVGNLAATGLKEYSKSRDKAVLTDLAKFTDKQLQAVRQGKLKQYEADLKIETFVSSSLTANPELATEIRQQTIAQTGTNTALEEREERLRESEEASKTEAGIKSTFINEALNAGYVKYNSDGSYDTDKMVDFGIKRRKVLSDLQDQKLRNTLTTSESAVAKREESQRNFSPIFIDQAKNDVEILLSNLDQFEIDPTTGGFSPETRKEFELWYSNAVQQGMDNIRLMATEGGLNLDDTEQFVKTYKERSDRLVKDVFLGDNTDLNLKKQILDQQMTEAGLDAMQNFDSIAGMTKIGAKVTLIPTREKATAERIQKIYESNRNPSTEGSDVVQPKTAKDFYNETAEVMVFGKDINTSDPQSKIDIVRNSYNFVKENISNIDVLNPDQRVGVSNSLDAITSYYSTEGTPENVGISKYLNNNQIKSSVDKLYKDSQTKSKMDKMATRRLEYIENKLKAVESYNPTTASTGNEFYDSLIDNLYLIDYSSKYKQTKEEFINDVFNLSSEDPSSTE